MDIIELYKDHSLQYATDGHKHCRPGWVNTACPFCTGNPGMHLGCEIEEGYFVCWRCGAHPVLTTISKLLGVTELQAKILIKQYRGKSKAPKDPKITIRRKSHKLPSGIIPLTNKHKRYLESRGFDPEQLEEMWNLSSTGPVSKLDKINYKHRILTPIYWNAEQVSFQTRLARETIKEEKKYLACPQDRELVNHKHTLYGKQAHWQKTGICVEGITDVWRFGLNSFATYGIKFTSQQVRIIAKTFQRVIVIFDNEPQALKQALKLTHELQFRGVDSFMVNIGDNDPGSMSQDDANHLIKTLL